MTLCSFVKPMMSTIGLWGWIIMSCLYNGGDDCYDWVEISVFENKKSGIMNGLGICVYYHWEC